ncbi:MAG: glycosyltransferase family A protein [Prolixibacteraceae bacterium]|jgi:glycosyltransferase involved in cell wall biosynthesis|nr:glycosyltransferase family A protein [Prolixibacteraceae bacterium]
MDKPAISVVIPTYNREKTIKRAIESIINQSISNWELIVVDDCSTDETVPIIEKIYSNEPRIKVLVQQQNGGANKSRNSGARVSGAPLITFFDSDDELHPLTLENHIEKFKANHKLGLSYVFATCVKNGQEVATFNQKVNTDAERSLLRSFHGIGSSTSGLCVRKDVFNEVDGFDELMPSHQDLDFFVRIARLYQIDFIENSNTTMYWDAQNRISDNPSAVIDGGAYFFNKHEQRLKELGIYHHVARKLTRKYALYGKNLKEAYRYLGKAIANKPLYVYAYVYALKLPLLYRRKID